MKSGQKLVVATALLITVFAMLDIAGAQADTPEGRWLTEDKGGVVEVYRCEQALCGRLVWFRMQSLHDDPLAIDNRNPDPQLRNKPLCGLVILSGFLPDGQDRWNGSAYDPESGHTYSAEMIMAADGHLVLRGYVGISLFGRSENWTRYTLPLSHCPAD